MTEYDYSPEGYTKYMETQNRVSNWVSEQNSRMDRYTNPYTNRSISTPPTDYTRHSSSRHRDGDHRSHQRSSSSSHAPRPEPKRSLTTPAEATPRSLHSHTHVPTQPTYYKQPASVSYVAPTTQLPKGYNTAYREYRYEPNSGEIVIPRPRAGETYVIIPPAGRRLEVVTDTYPSSRSSSKSSARSPVSSSKKDQPLLKRLFTGFGNPPSSKLSRSSTTTRRERTRSY